VQVRELCSGEASSAASEEASDWTREAMGVAGPVLVTGQDWRHHGAATPESNEGSERKPPRIEKRAGEGGDGTAATRDHVGNVGKGKETARTAATGSSEGNADEIANLDIEAFDVPPPMSYEMLRKYGLHGRRPRPSTGPIAPTGRGWGRAAQADTGQGTTRPGSSSKVQQRRPMESKVVVLAKIVTLGKRKAAAEALTRLCDVEMQLEHEHLEAIEAKSARTGVV